MSRILFYFRTDKIIPVSFFSVLFMAVLTDCSAQYRPSLFFREDFKEIPAATPVTQDHIANRDLILGLYGPGCDSIKKSHHDTPSDDPYYIWSGLCPGNWAVTFKDSKSWVDLTGYAKIVWRSKQSGIRCLHPVLKLSDGTWLVGVQGDCISKDWRMTELNIMDINWYTLNIKSVIELKPFKDPDLSRVDEIGFTDLMTGGASDACSRLDWIEVYGKRIAR
jgi:hypothetical protein